MENLRSSLKQPSLDSGRRSLKGKGSVSPKAARDSKSLRVSTITEESTDADVKSETRKSITDKFFDSFFEPLVVERRPIKLSPSEESSADSLSVIHPLSANSWETSYSSVSETVAVDGKRGSANSKEPSMQKTPISSRQSINESTGADPSCDFNCTCNWRMVFFNGNVYEGQLNGDLMEGKGTFYWHDGSIYQGEFRDGYPEGAGKLTLPDLSVYEGEFSMGFFHGNGSLNVKSSPILYKGQWRLSQRHGKGWLLYKADDWYEGDWVDDQRHGIGYRNYSNGDKFKGNWLNDRINGEGSIMWHNNDYYAGEWSEGYPHGYGEYTWNLIPHDGFVFPNYNWYKGNWVNGLRSGAGIMSFGHESGAKLAGTWLNNKKDGPGVMICGNGMTLEKNPLFTEDKPSAYVKEAKSQQSGDSIEKRQSVLQTFKSISKQIFSKNKLESLHPENVTKITKSGTTIKMRQYIKLLEKNTGNAPPLKIPIYNVIHEVDLEYFVDDFVPSGAQPKLISDISTLEIEHMINTQQSSNFSSDSHVNYLPSSSEWSTGYLVGTTESLQCAPNATELQNLLINYLPQLRRIYQTYATLCVKEQELTFQPVLVRLFLWQLYRDIGVTEKPGVSIVEIDERLMKNPNSCLETTHNPWEPIYFWQFLQALVGMACLLFTTENQSDYTPSAGFMYYMVKHFLESRLLVHAGNFQDRFLGNCLTYLKDLVPIDAVYGLYRKIGEPHTVEDFLKHSCLKEGQRIPCYKALFQKSTGCTVQTGTNVVILNQQVLFRENSPIKKSTENRPPLLYEGLYTFSGLGRKRILKTFAKICPQVLLPSGRHNSRYRLSFIEFYEVILVLAYEKVEKIRLALLEDVKSKSVSDMKSTTRVLSRSSTHANKKRKTLVKKYNV
ncbi:uncharacterized protein LOC109539829 isoform X3 [Dendroctonus ponderosae]|uniref:uncharacterized protein LOC109539829 isoform X3 n=1 Tax=Dendroctonus ponderosae TaxID=77166 RepID=UPI002035073D|nr:uncharacterized protein LOC109539829 isoform X3 [Dendroctonus ponderosae]